MPLIKIYVTIITLDLIKLKWLISSLVIHASSSARLVQVQILELHVFPGLYYTRMNVLDVHILEPHVSQIQPTAFRVELALIGVVQLVYLIVVLTCGNRLLTILAKHAILVAKIAMAVLQPSALRVVHPASNNQHQIPERLLALFSIMRTAMELVNLAI